VRKEIEQIEARMQALRTQSGLVSLRAGSVGQQQTEDLATAAAKATEQRSEIEANLARAQAAVSIGASDELASVLGSETISRLREQEAEASAKVADLSARFGPEYPALRSAQADLSAIRREVSGEAHRIVASLASQLQVARAHEADVQAQLAKADQEGVKAQDVQAQLQQLEQDATTRRALYSTLLEREQQTVAQPHNDEMAEVRVLSAATVPGLPSAPNMKLSAGLGGLAGAMFAGLVAVARGLSHARFNGDADIQSATGATVLARLRGRGGKARWARLLSGTGTLETEDAAALRGANIRLRAGGRSGSARVVAVTGAQSGLAASGIAAALARNVAHEGEPALLIETVARQGAVAWFAGDAAGADWRDAVLHEPGSQLDILSGAGPVDADMSAKRVALENLLVEAREDYNLIVFAAPMASEPGALAIARAADTTVLVVDETAADPAATREAAKRLAGMSRARLGAIVVGAA
jgi:Mrp family chromosome partitioning ATPase